VRDDRDRLARDVVPPERVPPLDRDVPDPRVVPDDRDEPPEREEPDDRDDPDARDAALDRGEPEDREDDRDEEADRVARPRDDGAVAGLRRSAAGTSSVTTAFVSWGMSFSRKLAMRSSWRRYSRASFAVSESFSASASVSIAV
jgi:hypothetical protein